MKKIMMILLLLGSASTFAAIVDTDYQPGANIYMDYYVHNTTNDADTNPNYGIADTLPTD